MAQSDRMARSTDRPWWLLPPGRVRAYWWLPVAVVVTAIEALFRFEATMVALYIIPVTMAAWYSGRAPALIISAALTGVHVTMGLTYFAHPRLTDGDQIRIAAITFVMLAFLTLVFARFGEYERRLTRQIRVLEGLLPICAVCKAIRDNRGQWTRLEAYIQERSTAQFSHGLCPDCVQAQKSALG